MQCIHHLLFINITPSAKIWVSKPAIFLLLWARSAGKRDMLQGKGTEGASAVPEIEKPPHLSRISMSIS
jgi:hypothetical protein